MKNQIILLFMLMALFLVSCDDLLTEEPRSLMDPAQFFNSDEEVIAATNGIYSRGVEYLFDNGGWGICHDYVSHEGTDIAYPTAGRESMFPFHTYTLSSSEDGALRETWHTLYRSIADANLVIARTEESKDKLSDDIYNRSIGEALFLRSLFYYVLTTYWGDVPFWVDELEVEVVSDLPRTSVDEIYNQLTIDLIDAADRLPSVYAAEDLGRVNKWAAKILLTKVYLSQENWMNAKATAADIIDNSPHTLLLNYDDVFGVGNEYNNEIIWEKDAVLTLYPNIRGAHYIPRAADEPSFGNTEINYAFNGYGLITSSDEFIASFDPDDKRISQYNLNGVYDDPDGDGVYDHWVQFNYRYVNKNCEHGSPRGNSGLNSIIYRLADAYLMYAEAENELNGPTSEAYAKINRIRDRAFNGNPEKRLSGLSKDEFRQAIMNERKWELAFEFHRRWDLKRWGILGEAVESVRETNPTGAANFQSYHFLFPIPFDELDLNPNLTQNPGY